jgi:CheY-like chemotaxis protein
LNGLKVLLAEDNPVNRVYASKLLEGLDMEVTAVEDGNQAVEHLRNERFDLAVLDIQMPGMDGLAVANVVRSGQYAINAKMPLVALTAHAMKGDREKFLESGMDDYVAKPVDETDLRGVLLRVLAKNARDARLA